MYDMSATKTMTGKLTRFIPGSNHAQLIFEVLGDDGKPVMENGKPLVWGVETGSAAAMARQGVTVDSFPQGTILTVSLHPLQRWPSVRRHRRPDHQLRHHASRGRVQ